MKTNLFKNMTTAIAALFIAMLALPQTAQAQTQEAYVVKNLDDKTLTFYYDTNRHAWDDDAAISVYGINDEQQDEDGFYPAWAGTYKQHADITKVVFDASFKDYRPQSTANWFHYCTELKEISGMENLNTVKVTDMGGMFNGCKALTSLDLSGFNTEDVTNMSEMFSFCGALTSLNLSGFNTQNVSDMSGMFNYCKALTSLDL